MSIQLEYDGDGNIIGGYYVPGAAQQENAELPFASPSFASQAQVAPAPMRMPFHLTPNDQTMRPMRANSAPNLGQSFPAYATQPQMPAQVNMDTEMLPNMSVNAPLQTQNKMYTQRQPQTYFQRFALEDQFGQNHAITHPPPQYDFPQSLQNDSRSTAMAPSTAATQAAYPAFGPGRSGWWTGPNTYNDRIEEEAYKALNTHSTLVNTYIHAHPTVVPAASNSEILRLGAASAPRPKAIKRSAKKRKSNSTKSSAPKRLKKSSLPAKPTRLPQSIDDDLPLPNQALATSPSAEEKQSSAVHDEKTFGNSTLAPTIPVRTQVTSAAVCPPNKRRDREARAWAFVNEFEAWFRDDEAVLKAFNVLCGKFNQKVISEAEFYVSMYRYVYATRCADLMAGLKDFMPRHWRDTNLDWLDGVAENIITESTAVFQGQGDLDGTTMLGMPRKKKVLSNSFRTGSDKHPVSKITTGRNAAPISTGAENTHDLSGTTANIKRTTDHLTSKHLTSKIVKLPLGSALQHTSPAIIPQKRKAMEKDGSLLTPDSTPNKKSRHQFGKTLASQIEHVGPVYPTRRAVLARVDRPYICALCGQGFPHAVNVQHHFGGDKRTGNGKGCWEKHGKPTGDAARWGSHPSCSVSYPDLNYAKVSDGYVILDQESHDKLEDACEAGRRFKRGRGVHGEGMRTTNESSSALAVSIVLNGKKQSPIAAVSTITSSETGETQMRSDNNHEAVPAIPKKSAEKKIVKAGDENEVSLRAAALGLRIRK